MSRLTKNSIRAATAVALGIACAGVALPAVAAPTKAELGAMLKKCSAEADAKGLTVQKGKGEARSAYRKQCMTKNGVAPRKP